MSMIAAGLAIIYLFPRITKAIPSPLVCILVLTAVALAIGIDIRTVGDLGELPDALPMLLFPDVPLNLDTLWIILPTSTAVAAVGLLESLLTASIVDQMTDTGSDKNRESVGQGIANIASGFFGGMAGCAMIGQSVINVKSGGRTRLSTFIAGAFLLVPAAGSGRSGGPHSDARACGDHDHGLDQHLQLVIAQRPCPSSPPLQPCHARNRHRGRLDAQPCAGRGCRRSAVGHLLCLEGRADLPRHLSSDADGTRRDYLIEGQLFFASAEDFLAALDFAEPVEAVNIDVSKAHIWDLTGVNAIDIAVLKFRKAGIEVEVIGLNEASATIMDNLARHDQPNAMAKVLGH